jgi:TusA-related sulfurtransferase
MDKVLDTEVLACPMLIVKTKETMNKLESGKVLAITQRIMVIRTTL